MTDVTRTGVPGVDGVRRPFEGADAVATGGRTASTADAAPAAPTAAASAAAARRPDPPGQVFLRGVWRENPVLVQLLGLCPALAVTNTVANSIAMSAATFFVITGSSLLVSTLKHHVPHEVRISTYVLIIATFVTVVDLVLAATVPEIHKSLGAFVALIIVNCMILGRQEAFASKKPVGRAVLDAAGTGAGFAIALLMMGIVREVLGSGTFLGRPVFGPSFEPWVIMVLPAGGFFTLGFFLLGIARWEERRQTGPEVRRWPHGVATGGSV